MRSRGAEFTVNLIPAHHGATNFTDLAAGRELNLEVDSSPGTWSADWYNRPLSTRP